MGKHHSSLIYVEWTYNYSCFTGAPHNIALGRPAWQNNAITHTMPTLLLMEMMRTCFS